MKLEMSDASLARCLLRVAAVVMFVVGLLQLTASLLESIRDFDPSYAGYFFMTVFLRPFLLLVASILLWWMAPALARRAANG